MVGSRIAHTITETESEWDETQRDLVAAYEQYQDDLCPGCGMLRSESMSEKAQDGYHEHDRIEFEGTALRCMGCQAMDIKKAVYKDEPATNARKFGVHRVTRIPKRNRSQ